MLEDNDSSDNIAATQQEDMTRVLSERKKIDEDERCTNL